MRHHHTRLFPFCSVAAQTSQALFTAARHASLLKSLLMNIQSLLTTYQENDSDQSLKQSMYLAYKPSDGSRGMPASASAPFTTRQNDQMASSMLTHACSTGS